MWAWGANTSEKKLRIASVLPIRFRGRPQGLADSLLPRKRSNRNLFFKERGTRVWRCSFSSAPPSASRQSWFVCGSRPSVVSGHAVHMSERGRRDETLSFAELQLQKFLCVWSFLEPKKQRHKCCQWTVLSVYILALESINPSILSTGLNSVQALHFY